MNQQYLIPANSKKSMLFLSMFNKVDMFIGGGGAAVTMIMMFTFPKDNLKQIAFILAPLLICAFLIVPIPNQHNIRTFIQNVYHYFTNRRTYYWRGWCVSHGESKSK